LRIGLAIAVATAVVVGVLLASQSGGTLTWAPPPCGDATHNCVDVNLADTGSHQSLLLSNASDYRVHLPASSPLHGGITINGGHNVVIVGGEIDLTFPCANDATA
jgi:hypothetical protein